jgi:hypothetical protein
LLAINSKIIGYVLLAVQITKEQRFHISRTPPWHPALVACRQYNVGFTDWAKNAIYGFKPSWLHPCSKWTTKVQMHRITIDNLM